MEKFNFDLLPSINRNKEMALNSNQLVHMVHHRIHYMIIHRHKHKHKRHNNNSNNNKRSSNSIMAFQAYLVNIMINQNVK